MQVGNKVVCIDDVFPDLIKATFYQLPVEGETYTIRAVFSARGNVRTPKGCDPQFEIGILLAELSNPYEFLKGGVKVEMGFNSERFRIIDESVALVVEKESTHGKEKVTV